MKKTIALIYILFGIGFTTTINAADNAMNPGQPNQNAALSSNGLKTSNSGDEKVNINTADMQTIANAINGIGVKRARAIVAYRDENGPFKTIDDIAKVKGISATFVKNRLSELNEKFTV